MTQKTDGALLVRPELKTKKPRMYGVVIYNDDFTPMDFVTNLLSKVFKVNAEVAYTHMMEIHKKGRTLFAPYTREVAETKATEIMDAATAKEHPLMAKFEPMP
jgi:ATP-dependent Clp protease adaptor protein ClpS